MSESEAFIAYAQVCEILSQIGYEDPSGNAEDFYLQFRLKDGQSGLPKVVTIDFPSMHEGMHGWPLELMYDFLDTQFDGVEKKGQLLRAVLNEAAKH